MSEHMYNEYHDNFMRTDDEITFIVQRTSVYASGVMQYVVKILQ